MKLAAALLLTFAAMACGMEMASNWVRETRPTMQPEPIETQLAIYAD